MESASLAGEKVGGDERKEAVGEKRHEGGSDAEKQAHPEHGTGEQLLGAIAALLFPHPHQRGHERLIHGLGDEVDEQAGDERRGEKGVHGVGAAINGGDADFLGGGDELDEDARRANGDDGAEDAAMDGGELGSARRWAWRAAWRDFQELGCAAEWRRGQRRSGAKARTGNRRPDRAGLPRRGARREG